MNDFRDTSQRKNCAKCGKVFFRDKRSTWKYWAKAKFCSRVCSARSGADNSEKIWGSLADRFWKKVNRRSKDECWEWTGAKRPKGYGVISVDGVQRGATWVSMLLHGKPLSDGMWALHKCDNPRCVNPDHLYEGTPKQNSKDAVLRNRFKRKLTPKQALEIKRSKKDAVVLANEYGVSDGLIYAIRNGRKWAHV